MPIFLNIHNPESDLGESVKGHYPTFSDIETDDPEENELCKKVGILSRGLFRKIIRKVRGFMFRWQKAFSSAYGKKPGFPCRSLNRTGYTRIRKSLIRGVVIAASGMILIAGSAHAVTFIRQPDLNNPFGTLLYAPLSFSWFTKPAIADIDGDGDSDVVIGSHTGYMSYYKNTGSGSEPEFTEMVGAGNPFYGINPGKYSDPAFADIDGDGDMDAFVGAEDGQIRYYKNTGSASVPAYTEINGEENPFNGVDVGRYSAPGFADTDSDGDMDAFIGEVDGVINYYQNTGSASLPVFTEISGTSALFNGVDVGYMSVPGFADIDADGDTDAFIGNNDGSVMYQKNTGSGSVPVFTEMTGAANPFDGMQVSSRSAPVFTDIDADGDMDAFIGMGEMTINYYQNTGTPSAPAFVLETADVGREAAISFADIDGDGDLDAFIGEEYGTVSYYRNTGSGTVPEFTKTNDKPDSFNCLNTEYNSKPAFTDADGDGDMDAFIGEYLGTIRYCQNTGSGSAPFFEEKTGADNPLNGVNVEESSAPAFTDIDGDGDMDAFIGEYEGIIRYYQNTGSASVPVFTERTGTGNPFNGADVGDNSVPAFTDVDGDGDMDAFIGEYYGSIRYYQNAGSVSTPVFTEMTGRDNPFNGVNLSWNSFPAFADINDDGDMEAFIGESFGRIIYYEQLSGQFSLTDAILVLKLLTGIRGEPVLKESDVNGDGRIDLTDLVIILRSLGK
ncbi:FG-GAP-like repeat-containing protein [Desulfococcaceae bacterium HSG8]|nr:FG-GAP-like repeat-containing protein [Desulfococcaceae bacterium HSG8]